MSSKVAAGSVKAASLNIVMAVTFRVITFALNVFVLRRVSPDVLGLLNVRLVLLDDTILFLSREGFRRACLGHRGPQWGPVVNLMWLCVPISVFWSCVLGWAWLHLLPSPAPSLLPQYQTAVVAVALSGVVEMFSEPAYIIGQVFMFHKLRVAMDFLWLVMRAAVLAISVVVSPQNVVLMFSLGHLGATVLYVAGYYVFFAFWIKRKKEKDEKEETEFPFKSIREFFPNIRDGVSEEHRGVAQSFVWQGIVKQLLTEGEKYAMTVFSLLTLSQQGVYDVVANLGSLAARFIFKPIEESAYVFFTQLWSRKEEIDKQKKENVNEVSVALFRLLRLMTLIGLVILTFGYSYSHLLLHLYGGSTLTSGPGPELLRAQCFLVLFLAVNGVTECFAFAVMTEAEVDSYNRKMVLMSVSYLFLTWLLTVAVGPVGFVLSNCCNMAVRIGHSAFVIYKTFSGVEPSPLKGIYPGLDLLFLLLCSALCCHFSELYIYPSSGLIHFAVGSVVFILTAATIIIKEEFILSFILGKVKAVWAKVKRE